MKLFYSISILLNCCCLVSSETNGTESGVATGETHDPIKLDKKKVVFFAGPDRSSEEGIEHFFHHWVVSGWRRGHPHLKALTNWRWPNPEDNKFQEFVFGELVTNPENTTLSNEILDGIEAMWDEAPNGVIVGTQLFDQVGRNALYDAMKPMDLIVSRLNVEAEDVTVILNYRTPRIEQWISIWQHDIEDETDTSYFSWMCKTISDATLRKERISQLYASMNALGAALTFAERGWKIKLIDLEGVHRLNKDVTHVIGCDILLGGCNDGFLWAHDKERTPEEDIPDHLDEVGEEGSGKIEHLFRYRDCGYKDLLQPYIDKDQIDIMYKYTIWADCDYRKKDLYSELANTDSMVYTALLSQTNCENIKDEGNIVTMDDALGLSVTTQGGGGGLESFFNNVVAPLVLIAAIATGVFLLYKHQSRTSANRNFLQTEMTSSKGKSTKVSGEMT